MRIATVQAFRDNATGLLRSKAPVLITRRGRLAAVFFPCPEESLPLEFKRDLFSILSAELARHLKKRKIREEEVQRDFEEWRKGRRASRG